MDTYKIVGKTNPWIANRDIDFNGKCTIVIGHGLTLKEAQAKLLEMYNNDNEQKIGLPYANWGLVRCNDKNTWSHNDGTRGYEYDSRYYYIEPDQEEEWLQVL